MSVLDVTTGTIRERVKVGEEPEGVTVSPDGREVYVTCEGDNEVVAVDTTTLKVVGRMKTAARPRSIVFTKDGATAFVTDENAATVTVIDTAQAYGRVVYRHPEDAEGPDTAAADGRRALAQTVSTCMCRSAGRRRSPSSTSPRAR